MKESVLKHITQVLLIVFSVVLGLYLSERIEESKNAKDAAGLLATIKSELNENKRLLDHWVPYHKKMVAKLDSLSKDELFIGSFIEDRSALYKVFTRGTIMSEQPANDAWDIAKSHPLIVNIDYDELLASSKIYKQQLITYESFPRMVESLVSPELNASDQAKTNLLLFKNRLQDITSREIRLVYYYDQAEKLLAYQSRREDVVLFCQMVVWI